jgi:1-acyl-sn-glycerol-3-phosphate acyltransferase
MISQAVSGAHVPKYDISWRSWARLTASALLRWRRSFSADSIEVAAGLQPPLEVVGGEHVPPHGPCLVTCNHYHRPGFNAWWIAVGITAALASHRAQTADRELYWLMTAAWTFPGAISRRVLTPITRWAFSRVAQVYGFIPMPPMPPSPDEVEARARAILQTLRLARRLVKVEGMIGLAPEGQDTTPGELGEPPGGAGEFIALLVEAGMPVLPAGISEVDGKLRVSFGPLFTPDIPGDRAHRDKVVAGQVMDAIARQLP